MAWSVDARTFSNTVYSPERASNFLPRDHIGLFLKILKNSSDIEVLQNAITLKKIDDKKTEAIIINFSNKLQRNLCKNDHPFNEHETRILLECFLNLLDCEGFTTELETITLRFYEIFKRVPRYEYEFRKPLQFPVEIHHKALKVCDNLFRRQLDNDSMVLLCIEQLINHKDLSADQQMELFRILRPFEGSKHYARVLSRCATIEHASPYFRFFVIEKLLKMALNKDEKQFTRLQILDNLPFDDGTLNIDIEFVSQSVETLLCVIKNGSEIETLRDLAIRRISIWLWYDQRNQAALTEQQKNSIDLLLNIIRHDDSKIIRDLTAEYLFKFLCKVSPSDQIALYLTEAFKSLLDDNDLHLSTKICLAHCLSGMVNQSLKKPRIIDLFFYMIEKIFQETHPIELRRIYTEYLIGCYSNEGSNELISQFAPHLATVEQFLNLEIFKINEDLALTAQIAFKEITRERQNMAAFTAKLIKI